MNRLRNRLILVFVVATLAPLCLMGWISVRLLRYSLSLSSTAELDQVSQSLKKTGHELFRQASDSLKRDAASGRIAPKLFPTTAKDQWPIAIHEFFSSGDGEAFHLDGDHRDHLNYLVRRADGVAIYTTSLHGIDMRQLTDQYTSARAVVAAADTHNWRRGFTYTYLLLAAAIWLLTFLALLYFAKRISQPIQELTKGLSEVAAGHMEYRVPEGRPLLRKAARTDEVGSAVRAFNEMAEELKQSQERLVYVTRLESWQALAKKMAHEVKNSLTPIRLTMEEIAARQSGSGGDFYEQAAQIVVDEVQSLERRVRAFSEFSAEPPVSPRPLDINSLLEERIAFLRTAHPDIVYSTRLAPGHPRVYADEDLVKGVLTNLLENAAQAVTPGGLVLGVTLGVTAAASDKITIEVHDSGPGLSPQARSSLFQPAISFKRGGMGLGLSIARKSALLAGGDILLVPAKQPEEPRSVSCFPWLNPLPYGRGSVKVAILSRARKQAVLLALLPALLAAQQTILRVPVRLIVAPTSVTDHAGNFVNGLTASDFRLFDNDVPQQVHEDGDFLPISLGIAVQTNLKGRAVDRIRELGPLLGALVVGVGGEAAIFSFGTFRLNGKLQVRQDFTPDLGRLTLALRRIEVSPGPNHVIDATLDAMRLLGQRPEGRRRILLMISTPTDQGSQSSLHDALADAAVSNTLIYWLNAARTSDTEDPVPVLTRYTGGQQYALQNEHALERAITQIGEEIHGQYLLSYTPANTHETGFHRIRVVSKRAGLDVRSRPGYWPAVPE